MLHDVNRFLIFKIQINVNECFIINFDCFCQIKSSKNEFLIFFINFYYSCSAHVSKDIEFEG